MVPQNIHVYLPKDVFFLGRGEGVRPSHLPGISNFATWNPLQILASVGGAPPPPPPSEFQMTILGVGMDIFWNHTMQNEVQESE